MRILALLLIAMALMGCERQCAVLKYKGPDSSERTVEKCFQAQWKTPGTPNGCFNWLKEQPSEGLVSFEVEGRL